MSGTSAIVSIAVVSMHKKSALAVGRIMEPTCQLAVLLVRRMATTAMSGAFSPITLQAEHRRVKG
jgi:hypothetical protein